MRDPGDWEGLHKLQRWSKVHLGGHDMMRRADPNGEVQVWCRKCSGYAWCRLEPTVINRCSVEKIDTKEHMKMLKRSAIPPQRRVPDRNATGWKVEGEKGRVTREECKRLREEFEVGGFMAQKGSWNICETLDVGGQRNFTQRGGRRC